MANRMEYLDEDIVNLIMSQCNLTQRLKDLGDIYSEGRKPRHDGGFRARAERARQERERRAA